MSTLVLVSPATRVDGSEERFSPGHVRELSDHFDRVIMVCDPGPSAPDHSGPVSLANGTVSRTDARTTSAPIWGQRFKNASKTSPSWTAPGPPLPCGDTYV